ncbi:MAG: N-acetyltransferase family protein [Hyphomicrobiales bacterium]
MDGTAESNGKGVTVRASRDTDVARVTEIYAQAVREGLASFEYDPPGAEEMARRRAALLAEGYPYLVAEVDGGIAGYAYAGAYRTRRGYFNTVEDAVYVDPAFHRRGVGGALLLRLVEECEALGFRLMVAVIGDSDNTGSIGLHRAAGFRLVGVFHGIGYKHGRWLDSVQMERALGPGESRPPTRK